jgi:phosphoserine phosphatase RsbU/P
MMAAAGPRLLVVDDNEDNRYTLTQRLKRQGYTDVTAATNVREALDLLAQQDFDLVLLDVMMPEMNGYEVLDRLKSDPRLRHLPVIMISAVDELESVVRCIKLGAEDYLAKPFNPVLLNARVGASLEKKRLRDETASYLARIEGELESAREIQLGMVPSEFPLPSAAAEIYGTLLPARQVGCDLFDFFHLDDGTLCLVVADVSGKGAPAALFMAHTNSVIRVAGTLLCGRDGERPSPAGIIEHVNKELCRVNSAFMFVTVFFAMLDPKTSTLSFCSAGHPMPCVIGASGAVTRVEGPTGIPLGIEAGFEYENGEHRLEPGDAIFMYTDGVSEATNSEHCFFTDRRLEDSLKGLGGAAPKAIVDKIVEDVRAFVAEAPQADDIAAMAVRLV